MRKNRNRKSQRNTNKTTPRIKHKNSAKTAYFRKELRLAHQRTSELPAGNSRTGTPLFPSLVNHRSINAGLLKTFPQTLKTFPQALKNPQNQAKDQNCSRSRKHRWWRKLPKLERRSLQTTNDDTGNTGNLFSLIPFNSCTYDVVSLVTPTQNIRKQATSKHLHCPHLQRRQQAQDKRVTEESNDTGNIGKILLISFNWCTYDVITLVTPTQNIRKQVISKHLHCPHLRWKQQAQVNRVKPPEVTEESTGRLEAGISGNRENINRVKITPNWPGTIRFPPLLNFETSKFRPNKKHTPHQTHLPTK